MDSFNFIVALLKSLVRISQFCVTLLDSFFKLIVSLLQRFFVPLPLTDVQYLGDEVAGLALHIEDQGGAYLAPKDLTAFVKITFFETLDAKP